MSLLEVVKDVAARNKELEIRVNESTNTRELAEIEPQFETIQNQLLELTGSLCALRWVLGDIDDLQFAVETGTSAIEASKGE